MKNIFLPLLLLIGLSFNLSANTIDDDKPLFTYQQAKVVNYDAITSHINYPKMGKDMGIEGTVNIRAYVNEEGQVTDYKVMKGSDKMLASAVHEAIMNLEFEPTVVTNTITGESQVVPSWVIVPFNFTLNY